MIVINMSPAHNILKDKVLKRMHVIRSQGVTAALSHCPPLIIRMFKHLFKLYMCISDVLFTGKEWWQLLEIRKKKRLQKAFIQTLPYYFIVWNSVQKLFIDKAFIQSSDFMSFVFNVFLWAVK